MLTIDDVGEILDEVAGELPEDFYRDLNGGINLLPESKLHDADMSNNLFVLGEYRRDQMGRYIVVYYGSLCRSYPGASVDEMRAHLKKLLIHEFTHHLESLAGERGLEYKDARRIAEYRENFRG